MNEEINSFRRMRQHNQRKVLELLHQERLISRIDIARRAHLQKQTVTNIVSELLAEQLVIEESVNTNSGVGRKPILLRLNREHLYAVGVEVTKSYIIGVVMNYNREVVFQDKLPLMQDARIQGSELTQALLRFIDRLMEHVPSAAYCSGLGVGVQGIVDSQEGIVLRSPYLGWYRFDLKRILSDRYRLQVYVDNNVRAFARGEVWSRPEKELSYAVCIYLDEGVGGSIIIGGELYTGADFYAGEIGHMKLSMEGPVCFCGQNGCLEAYVSVSRIKRELGLADRSFEQVREKLEEGYSAAVSLLDEVGIRLGFMIGNTLNMLNPSAVILGGELVTAAPWYKQSMIAALQETAITKHLSTPILFSDYDRNNCSMGAAALVFHQWLQQQGGEKR